MGPNNKIILSFSEQGAVRGQRDDDILLCILQILLSVRPALSNPHYWQEDSKRQTRLTVGSARGAIMIPYKAWTWNSFRLRSGVLVLL